MISLFRSPFLWRRRCKIRHGVGVVRGSAAQSWSAVATTNRVHGGMVLGVTKRNPGWTELWSERAAFPRREMRSNSLRWVRAKSLDGDSSVSGSMCYGGSLAG
ncbi:MAG: hypothetical protein PUB29_08430 [Bacteroidales bacterium]|nr:hypothetical protein [Bacteroidales bacterium]